MRIQSQVPRLIYCREQQVNGNGSAVKNNNQGSVTRNGTRSQRKAMENSKRGSDEATQEVEDNRERQCKAVSRMEE
jgi:hypothetical protein